MSPRGAVRQRRRLAFPQKEILHVLANEPRVSLGRHGTPEDVAGLVSFLLSDDSSYATGTTHSVDGGFTTA